MLPRVASAVVSTLAAVLGLLTDDHPMSMHVMQREVRP